LEAGRSAGADAGGIILKSTVAGSGGGGDVDQAPTLVVVEDGQATLAAILAGISTAVLIRCFNQGSGGGVAFGGDMCRAPGRRRRPSSWPGFRPCHVIARRAPAIIRARRSARTGCGAGSYWVGLDAAIFIGRGWRRQEAPRCRR
jgi:hypothetical protein